MKGKHILIGGLAFTARVVGIGLYRAANTGMKLELSPVAKLGLLHSTLLGSSGFHCFGLIIRIAGSHFPCKLGS